MGDLKRAKANLCERFVKGEVIASTEKDDYMDQFAEEIERQKAYGMECTVETRLGVHYLLTRHKPLLNMGQDIKEVANEFEKKVDRSKRKFDN